MVVSTAGVASKEKTSSHGSPERKTKGIRSKEGCLTCRIRRKKCDQGKHADSCESCRRLHIECLGYSRNRPEWLKGVKVEEFKRTIKRFLAENSPKSGLHARQDPSVPVPFLSFEGLRGRVHGGLSAVAGPSGTDYNIAADPMAIDQLADDTDGSDDEAPRHYQLLPLNKKEPPVLFKSPEPIADDEPPGKTNDVEMTGDKGLQKSEERPADEELGDKAPTKKQHGETSVVIDPAIVGPSPSDPELMYYANVIFPVLHELAGFGLSSHELLTVASRETGVRNVLIAQAKHHQNRIKFLTSTDGPHHQSTQKLCLDLAASSNAYVSALNALSPAFERATRHNDIDMLAVLYTLLHFGGIGELLSRHIARRGNQGSASGNGFILELSCRWLASSIAHFTDLASALRRSTDRQRALIQAAIHIDIYSSIALCRPPHFLDSYRAAFKHPDTPILTDSNGGQVAVQPRLDDLLDIPAKTILALAETSAMASWKAEHVRHGSLSVMDLSRWAKRIDVLLAPPSPESLLPPAPIPLSAGPRPSGALNIHTKLVPVLSPVPPLTESDSVSAEAPGPATVHASDGANQSPAVTIANGLSGNEAPNTSGPTVNTSTVAVAPSTPDSAAPGLDPISEDQAPASEAAPNPVSESKDTNGAAAAPSTASQTTRAPQHSPAPPVPVDSFARPSYRRTLPPATREVFRCAGRVFLHTVLSGEHPRVHDIAQAVSDTCGALRELGLSYLPPATKPTPADDLRFPVVRGLPFCIFIAGSVAGSMEQGMFLRSCLRPVIREIDMQTAELLTAVLSERAGSGDVSWFSVMNKRGSRLVFM